MKAPEADNEPAAKLAAVVLELLLWKDTVTAPAKGCSSVYLRVSGDLSAGNAKLPR